MISLEYLAGVLDVNGSLCITQLRRSGGPRVLILIQHKERHLAELFAERFGGKVMFSQLAAGERWHWQKQGLPAQAILRELRPHMKIRLREVDRLLSVPVRKRGKQPRMASPIRTAELMAP